MNDLLDAVWEHRTDKYAELVFDQHLSTKMEKRIRFGEIDESVRQKPYKLNDLYLANHRFLNFVLQKELCLKLTELLGGHAPMVRGTVNFEWGSQQPKHTDNHYTPSYRRNGMLASWVALDSVNSTNGPLEFFPGSHVIKDYVFQKTGIRANRKPEELEKFNSYIESELDKRNLKPQIFEANAGDVIVWKDRMVHGGRKIEDKAVRRRSIVSHYFRMCDYAPLFWKIGRLHGQGYYYKRRYHSIP